MEALLEVSRKKDIERVAALERARRELVADYMREGASELEAMLRSTRALEDRGYLPKSPRLVARKLSAPEADALRALPLFSGPTVGVSMLSASLVLAAPLAWEAAPLLASVQERRHFDDPRC